jgi:hypothetical protein
MEWKNIALATAVAGLFIAGGAHAVRAEGGAEAQKIHCEGVNACKGQSECKSATNDCAGHNACKGKGWVSMTQEECDQAKAEQAH